MRTHRLLALSSAAAFGAALLIAPVTVAAAAQSPGGGVPAGASSPVHAPWQAAAAANTKVSAPTLKTLTASLANTVPAVVLQVQTYPWSYYGDPVTLNGIVDLSRVPGGGTLFFYDGKALLGAFAVDVNGQAQMGTTTLKPGNHTLTALYKTNPKSGTTSAGVAVPIYKRPLTLYPVAAVYSRPVGAANPTFHTELYPDQGNGGLVNGDTFLSAVTGSPKFSTTAGAKSPPSVYAVTLSGLSSTNYSLVYKRVGLIVYSKVLAAGSTAPNFTAKDQNGATVNLSDFRGKVVLLDLSTLWCGPSEFMGTQMRAVISNLQQRGVPFTYLSVQLEGFTSGVGGTQNDAHFAAAHFHLPSWGHVLHPQGLEPTIGQPLPPLWDVFYSISGPLTAPGTFNENFGLGAVPTLAMIDASGKIAEVDLGAIDKDDLIPNHLDPIAPDTGVQVTSAPQMLTNTTSVSFVSTHGAPTTCRVDNGTFTPCTSPYAPAIADGTHEIQISAGQPFAASVPFQLDGTPPDTTITSGPGSDPIPQFDFTTDDGVTFECWVDAETPSECQPPWPLFNLPGGLHTFHVAAVDTAGNVDPTPATADFTTNDLPDMTAEVQPANPTTADDVQIVVTVTDASTHAPVTGSVAFYDDQGNLLDTPDVDAFGHATLDLGQLPPLSMQIFAVYSGDSTHGGEYITVPLTVT